MYLDKHTNELRSVGYPYGNIPRLVGTRGGVSSGELALFESAADRPAGRVQLLTHHAARGHEAMVGPSG